MSLSLGIAIYVICWWIVLFAVLPLRMGAKPMPPVSDPFAEAAGAPSTPKMKLKFIVTTIIAAAIVSVLYGVLESGVMTAYVQPAFTSK